MNGAAFSASFMTRPTIVTLSLLVLLTGIACQAPSSIVTNQPPQPRHSAFGSKGSPWTILCLEMRGPYRMDNIGQIADTLRRTPGIKPSDVFYIDEADGMVRLYHGLYYRKTDRKTGKRSKPRKLRKDLDTIKHLGTKSGDYFFLRARTVRLPTKDAGNPAWNLANIDGAYSLQVAFFEPTDEFWDFKATAAEYCAVLREKGFEAYYFHTEASSCVTVGIFQEDAVVPRPQGLPTYSAEVTSLQQSDDLLKYNRVNGAVYRAKTDMGVKVRVPSRLVHMPNNRETPW
ncbi:MAG: hypothetical protein IID42_14105 [Planctomycetes bacterium]|nr:hypothetical protein [Planctomycetota bacterium]